MTLSAKYVTSPNVQNLWCVGIYDGERYMVHVAYWTNEYDAKEQTRHLNKGLSYEGYRDGRVVFGSEKTSEHTCSALKLAQLTSKNRDCPACRAQDGVECTCPDFWFPEANRKRMRRAPHGFGGVLQHHESCAKRKIL